MSDLSPLLSQLMDPSLQFLCPVQLQRGVTEQLWWMPGIQLGSDHYDLFGAPAGNLTFNPGCKNGNLTWYHHANSLPPQNHRMVGVGRDQWSGSSGSSGDHLAQILLKQVALAIFKESDFIFPLGSLFQSLIALKVTKIFLYSDRNFLQFVPVVPYPHP